MLFRSNKKRRNVRRGNSELDEPTSRLNGSESHDEFFRNDLPKHKPRILSKIFKFVLLLACVGALAISVLYYFIDTVELKGEKTGRINVLLVGVDNVANLADTIIIVSIDTTSDDSPNVAMISIPRDLAVSIQGFGTQKINGAYSLGESTAYNGDGIDLLRNVVSNTFDISVHYYGVIDFEAFVNAIDLVGGVDIEVKNDIYDPYFPDKKSGYEVYSIRAGHHHMSGTEALKYARSRQTTTDFDRSARQQQILVALQKELLTEEIYLNPKKIIDIQSIMNKNIKTDISTQELIKFSKIASTVNASNIRRHVLDNSENNLLIVDDSYGYYLLPRAGDYTQIHEFISNIFSKTDDTLPQAQR